MLGMKGSIVDKKRGDEDEGTSQNTSMPIGVQGAGYAAASWSSEPVASSYLRCAGPSFTAGMEGP